ncbi:hypothetical protein [Saccharopolyspora elongata]|uniref:hypothetical protein n=1 Tax=Saccharopolyspora elongata TaxID=2530387 RepID=UPI0014055891|nr:hypothetical protein [Saccharopolyspora elongata]
MPAQLIKPGRTGAHPSTNLPQPVGTDLGQPQLTQLGHGLVAALALPEVDHAHA